MSFAQLRRHRYQVALHKGFGRPIDEDYLDDYLTRVGTFYAKLTDFYEVAARQGQCTIFWTA